MNVQKFITVECYLWWRALTHTSYVSYLHRHRTCSRSFLSRFTRYT